MMTPTAALTRYVLDRSTMAATDRKRDEVRFGFRAAGWNFLLGAAENVQIIDARPVCPLPGTPCWCAGLINLHGILLPVFDLARLPDGGAGGNSRYIMVFGQGSRSAGIYIDSLPGAVTLNQAPEPVGSLNNDLVAACTDRQYRLGNLVWLETAFDRLFTGLSLRFQNHGTPKGRVIP